WVALFSPLGELPRRGSESKVDHLQPCCFRLNFSLIIQGFSALGKTALSTPLQCTFNARLLKNPLKVTVLKILTVATATREPNVASSLLNACAQGGLISRYLRRLVSI